MIPYISPVVRDRITRMPGVKVQVHEDERLGCGRCVEARRQLAIELSVEDSAFFEKSVRRIEPLVDVKSE
jgi:hypothetical protein